MPQDKTIIGRMLLNFVPSYFSKAYPNKELVGLITNGQDYLLDLKTAKMIPVTGDIDPVPTPDGLFLSTIDRNHNPQTMHFFLTHDITDTPAAGNSESWPSQKYDVKWAYQSIGKLSGDDQPEGLKKYRLLVDDDKSSLYIRNFNFNFQSRGDDNPKFVEGDWVKLCPNIGDQLKLPMLSKDGHQIATFNVAKQKTVIYKVADNGNCEERAVLPFQTGKADFSFDNNKVTFHMRTNGTILNPQWFQFVPNGENLNIYTYDIEKQKLTQITHNPDGSSYFPTYRKSGSIGFFDQHINLSDPEHWAFYYVIADPAIAEAAEKRSAECKSCLTKQTSAAEVKAVAGLLSLACQSAYPGQKVRSATDPVKLNGSQCRDVVNAYWDKFKNDIVKNSTSSTRVKQILAELPASAMLSACPGSNAGSAGNAKETKLQNQAPHSTKDALKIDCSGCHAQSPGKFDFANPGSMPKAFRFSMADRIDKGTMPPGGLQPAERSALSSYLRTLKITP